MDKIRTSFILLTAISSYAFSQQTNEDQSIPKPLGDEAFNAVQEFFKYDKTVAIDTRIIETTDEGAYKLEKFIFRNTKGKLVTGYLAIPKLDKLNYPCMVLLHAGAGAKDDWWSEDSFVRGLSFVNNLLTSGIAIMALDAEAHGERAIDNEFISIRRIWFEEKLTYKLSDIWLQSTKDYHQGIDYIFTRKEIDRSRIGIMGYSLGGAMTSYLCTQIPQIKIAVMCSVIPFVKEISPPIYPLNFAPRIPDIPVLVLSGNKDELVSETSVKEFERLIKSNKKKLILYESGHFLPKEYLKDAFEWIKLNL
ncbi:MAG: dienelactone hydrolase family protein [Cyclobacteriaceae bacterium]